MAGLIYLITAVVFGYGLTERFLFRGRQVPGANRVWFLLPVSFGSGTLLLTWMTYVFSWAASVLLKSESPLIYGNILSITISVGISWLLFRELGKENEVNSINSKKKKKQVSGYQRFRSYLVSDRKLFRKEAVFFGILLAVVSFMMFYVFYIKDGNLYSGYTVFSDYAPHTAMMRSFSRGNNFPTQYPHFAGEDVKYHFMFQFLAGNLEFLGLPLDWAYNLPSILSLTGFLILLYLIAVRITGRMSCGILSASVLFFFRSGTAIFKFIWEHRDNLKKAFVENYTFIGYTEHEDWGLWNFNVYLNQRHLAFGLLLIAAAIWLYMGWLEAGTGHEETGFVWLKGRLFSKEAWVCRNPEAAVLLGVILGLSAFWNGATLIAGLLVLFGFAAFSDGKLDYALTAIVSVVLAFAQTRLFIRGQSMAPKFQFGFIADEKSLWGVLVYLVMLSGVFFLGLLVLMLFQKRKERVLILSFLLPFFFAFTVSLTPDVTVNHKYVMISYAFLTIFWADVVCRMFSGGVWRKVLAVLLTLCITATGIYDFFIVLKNNKEGRHYVVSLESDVADWLSANLGKDDLLLTPQYSLTEVTLSGAMLYCGWPYYAWSAGYDTDHRGSTALEIYTTGDNEILKEDIEQEHISYILYESGMYYGEEECREDIIADTYPVVYESKDGRMKIYGTNVE